MTIQELAVKLREQYNADFLVENHVEEYIVSDLTTVRLANGENLPEKLLLIVARITSGRREIGTMNRDKLVLGLGTWEKVIIEGEIRPTPMEIAKKLKKQYGVTFKVIHDPNEPRYEYKITRVRRGWKLPEEFKNVVRRVTYSYAYDECVDLSYIHLKRVFAMRERELEAIKALLEELPTVPVNPDPTQPDENDARLCEHCENAYLISDNFTNVASDGEPVIVCEGCLDDHYRRCDACEDWVDTESDDYTSTDYNTYCETCAPENTYHCESCDYTYDGDEYDSYDGMIYCNSCFRDRYSYCDSCNEDYPQDEGAYCEDCSESFCNNCWDEHEHNDDNLTEEQRAERDRAREEAQRRAIEESRLRNPYRQASTEFYRGEEAGTHIKVDRFVGIEIEAEQGDTYGLGVAVPEEVGISTDGSLSVKGVEVQTPPATLNKVEEFVTKACEGLQSKGYKGTKSCGLHVHIDARDIRNDHKKITQVIKTFYALEDILYSMLPPSRWNSRYSKRLAQNYLYTSFREKNDLKDVQKAWYKEERDDRLENHTASRYNGARYYGLNVHSLFFRGTIELRYHSGTIKPSKILHWTDLMLRIVDWAINNYDEKKVERLFDLETGFDKLRAVLDLTQAPYSLEEYMKLRISKFNPNFNIKFNKGKKVRSAERRTLTRKRRQIDTMILKCQEKHYKVLKAQWGNHSDVSDERLNQEAKTRAQDEILGNLPSEMQNILYNKNLDGGFMTTDEMEKTLALIQQGRNLQLDSASGEEVDEE